MPSTEASLVMSVRTVDVASSRVNLDGMLMISRVTGHHMYEVGVVVGRLMLEDDYELEVPAGQSGSYLAAHGNDVFRVEGQFLVDNRTISTPTSRGPWVVVHVPDIVT